MREHVRTRAWLSLLLLVVSALPSAWLLLRFPDAGHLGLFQDDAIYWVTAQGLAAGGGYRIASLPGEPAQTKYPPLYPAVLALSAGRSGSLHKAVLSTWTSALLLLGAAWLLFRQLGLGPLAASSGCLLLGWNASFALFSVSLTAEPLFALLVALALIAADRAAQRKSPGWALAAGALGGLAYLAKTAALVLLVAIPAWLLWRKRRKEAAAALCAMAPALIGWTLWRNAHAAGGSDVVTLYYTDYLRYQFYNAGWTDLPRVVAKNLLLLLPALGKQLAFYTGGGPGIAGFLAVLGLSLRGALRGLRATGLTACHAFAVCYIPVLLAWHFLPNERFVFPLAPLLIAGFVWEISHLFRLFQAWREAATPSRRRAAALGGSCLAGLLIWLCFVNAQGVWMGAPDHIQKTRARYEQAGGAFRWIARRLPPQTAVLAYHDAVVYLRTHHQAIRAPAETRPFYLDSFLAMRRQVSDLPGFAGRYGLQYLLWMPDDFGDRLDSAGRAWLADRLAQDARLTLVYQDQGARIYRVDSDGKPVRKLKSSS